MEAREEAWMKLYVLRHGETEWNKEEIFRGRKDIPLNAAGMKQVVKAGGYFTGKPVEKILSSPLSRAVQTAQAIGRVTGVPVEATEELTDINFGVWEGRSLKDVEEHFPADLALWRASPQDLRVEGGETLAEVRERVWGCIKEIGAKQKGAVIVATHRVICKVIVLSCLGIDNSHFWDMRFDPASITLLEGKDNRFSLIFANDTCHLRDRLASGYTDF
jgi:broad specificity phosphatase PhoE